MMLLSATFVLCTVLLCLAEGSAAALNTPLSPSLAPEIDAVDWQLPANQQLIALEVGTHHVLEATGIFDKYHFPDPSYCPEVGTSTAIMQKKEKEKDKTCASGQRCCYTPLKKVGFISKISNKKGSWPSEKDPKKGHFFECKKDCAQEEMQVCSTADHCSNFGQDYVCCRSKNTVAPGFCTKADACQESTNTQRCDPESNLDCAEGFTCCREKKGLLGFCRKACAKDSEMDFGCGSGSKCEGSNKCCQSTQNWQKLTHKCASTCASGSVAVDLTTSPFMNTLGGLAAADLDSPSRFIKSIKAQRALRHNMLASSEIISRAVEDPEMLQQFLQYENRKEILDQCPALFNDAKLMTHHIINLALLPMSSMVLGELGNAKELQNLESKPAKITKELVRSMVSPQLSDQQVASVLQLIEHPFITDSKFKGFEKEDKQKQTLNWMDFVAKFENAMSDVNVQCLKYATTVREHVLLSDEERKTINKVEVQAKLQIDSSDAIEHEFSLYHDALSLIKEEGEDDLFQRKVEGLTVALQGLKQCKTIWQRIFFGTHYLKKSLEKNAAGIAMAQKIAVTALNTVGTLASGVTFGGSSAFFKTATSIFQSWADKKAAKVKQTNELFFDMLTEKQNEYQEHAIDRCQAKNVDYLLLCFVERVDPIRISTAAKKACDKIVTEVSDPKVLEGLKKVPSLVQTPNKEATQTPLEEAYHWLQCVAALKDPKSSTCFDLKTGDVLKEVKEGCAKISTHCKEKGGLTKDVLKSRYLMEKYVHNVRYEDQSVWRQLLHYVTSEDDKKPRDQRLIRPLRSELVKYRERIRSGLSARFDKLPFIHEDVACRWDHMIREQLKAIVKLFKDVSSAMGCVNSDATSSEHFKKSMLTFPEQEGFEDFANQWERIFSDDDGLEFFVEALLTFVENGSDLGGDLIDAKFGLNEKYIKNIWSK